MAPDPFVFLEAGGRKILLMSDLEVDRARQQARVDEVLSLSEWEAKAKQRWPQPRLTDTLSLLFEDYGVRAVEVPADFPLEAADRLRERGVTVQARPHPFFPERVIKSAEEVAAADVSLLFGVPSPLLPAEVSKTSSTSPTLAVCPSFTRISLTRPVTGDGSSTTALSVSTLAIA